MAQWRPLRFALLCHLITRQCGGVLSEVRRRRITYSLDDAVASALLDAAVSFSYVFDDFRV